MIDMQATVELSLDVFGDTLQYMEDYVAQYIVEFPDSESRWVPTEYIKYLYRDDKNFFFRRLRFVKMLTKRSYRVESEDTVMDLGAGNIGTTFLSWDMTVALILNESKAAEGKKVKGATKEVPLVQEMQAEQEERLSEQVEASMALVLLQKGDLVDEPDRDMEPQEIIDALPELDVTTLNPLIMDGVEFLLLDDIAKSLGLREDEALSILAISAGM